MSKTISNSTQRRVGVVLSYVSMLCGVLISLFYHPFLFEHLGGSSEAATVQYGLNSFVSSLTTWMSLLSSALGSSYIRFATLAEKENGEEGLKRTNGVYLLFFVIVSGIAMVVGAVFFALLITRVIPLDNYDASSRGIIYKLTIMQVVSIVLNTPIIIATCFLTYRQKFIWQKAIAIATSLLSPLITVPFLLNGCSVLVTSLISLSVSLVANLAHLFYAIRRYDLKASFSKDLATKQLAKTIFGFCAIILFNTVVDQIESQIDKSILGFMTDASAVTIYTVGITFDTYLVTASYAFSSVYSPEINALIVKGDKVGLQKLFDKICKVELAIIFTAWGGFTACGQSFVINWAGADKAQGYVVGVVLMGLRSFALGCNPCIEVQRALNKVKFRAVAYSIGAVANVGLSILFVYLLPKEQAVYGCVIGTVISSIGCKWIAMTIYNQHIGLDMRKYLLWYGLYVLGAGAAVGLSYWISSYLTFSGWRWAEPITRGALFVAFFLPVLVGYNWKWIKGFAIKLKKRLSPAVAPVEGKDIEENSRGGTLNNLLSEGASFTRTAAKPFRNSGIDLLKLIAMLLIVVSHCVQSLGTLHPSLNVDQSAFIDISVASLSPTNIILVLLYGLGCLGNVIFLLCSVWFLTSSKVTKYQKIFQLLLDTFFISVVFLLGYLVGGANLSFKEIFTCLLPTLFSNNWYVTCYLLIYLVHPLLNAAIEWMNKRFAMHVVVILSFLYFIVCTVLTGQYFANNLITFLVIYVVMGCLQKLKGGALEKIKPNIWMIAIGVIGYLAMILGTEFAGVKFGVFSSSQLRWATNNNIFLLLIALGSFNLFRKISFRSKTLAFLANHTLFIYLIHENILFRAYTRPLIFPWIHDTFGYRHVIGWTLLVALCLYVASMVLSIAYGQTLGRLTKLASKKISSLRLFRPLETRTSDSCVFSSPEEAPIPSNGSFDSQKTLHNNENLCEGGSLKTAKTTKKNSRNTTLYFFEIFACVAIVFMHVQFPGVFGSWIIPGIARFGVPLFFTVAGFYLIKPGMSKEELREKLKKRIIHVLTLIALATVIYFAVGVAKAYFGQEGGGISAFIKSVFTWQNVLRLVLFNYPTMNPPTWFLVAMLCGYLILYLLAKQLLEHKWIAYAIALLLPTWIAFRAVACLTNASIGGYLVSDAQFYYNWFANGLPFMCLGIVLSRHQDFLKRISTKWAFVIYCASFVLMTLEFCLLMNYLNIYMSYYPSHVMNVIAIIALSLKKPNLFTKSKLLNLKGNFTAYVYLFHPAVIAVTGFLLNKTGIASNTIIMWIKPLVVLTITLVGAIIFNWIVCFVKDNAAPKKEDHRESEPKGPH